MRTVPIRYNRRDFIENSSFHKQQTLGRKSEYCLRKKLPPMKADFKPRPNFFKKVSSTPEEKTVLKKPHMMQPLPKVDHKQSIDKIGTNTLTYSETNKPPTHDSSGNGKNTSELNTVFKLTEKPSKGKDLVGEDEHNENDISQLDHIGNNQPSDPLTKSQHIEGSPNKSAEPVQENFTKSNFLDSKVTNTLDKHQSDEVHKQDTSEVLGESEVKEGQKSQAEETPEFKHVWFQFHTDGIYCNVSSLSIRKDEIEYGVPFGVAKQILRSDSILKNFLNHCTFKPDGQLEFDLAHLETLKNMDIENEIVQEIDQDLFKVNGQKLGLRYFRFTKSSNCKNLGQVQQIMEPQTARRRGDNVY